MNEKRNFQLRNGKTGAAITVRIGSKASKDEISEILNDGTIKIRLAAGPGDQMINAALVEFISKVLDVPVSQIEIVGGLSGKDKIVSILGLEAEIVQKRILQQLA